MQRIKIALRLLILLLGTYFLLRLVFSIVYFQSAGLSFFEWVSIFYWGLRMDFTALFYINIGFFIYYFLIAPLLPSAWQHKVSVILFSLINLPFIALNVIDLVYYRYNLRRSTIDIFYVFGDSIHSFGGLFKLYWWVLLLFIITAIAFVYISGKIFRKEKTDRVWYSKWLAPLAFLCIGFLMARGWDSRPIVPSTALLYNDPALQPVVNNSTLNLLYSYLHSTKPLERKAYFTSTQLDSIYPIRRQYNHPEFQKRNVVVFVLESFAESFFTPGIDRAQTPFFDSIRNKSTLCTNTFANGHESVKGLLAILGSIPPFNDEALFISDYSAAPFRGIGTILKEEGYTTNFFLGAEYDHFNFAKLCRMTGIDDYYSKDTYGHPEQDDGNWGIYDGYFFPYFAGIVSKKKQPFFSVLFNISSHPPYAIPASLKKQFAIPGQRPELNGVTYVDDCFRKLFDEIKNQSWFRNTIFVFVSDHTFLFDYDRDRSYQYKSLHIPFFIYDPRQPQQVVIEQTTQQLDVVPTILDKLGYSKPFMSFGNSILGRLGDSSERSWSIYKGNEGYQLTGSGMLTGYDEGIGKILYHYNYRVDSLLKNNLAGSNDTAIASREMLIKAIIQQHNNSLIYHRLLIR